MVCGICLFTQATPGGEVAGGGVIGFPRGIRGIGGLFAFLYTIYGGRLLLWNYAGQRGGVIISILEAHTNRGDRGPLRWDYPTRDIKSFFIYFFSTYVVSSLALSTLHLLRDKYTFLPLSPCHVSAKFV